MNIFICADLKIHKTLDTQTHTICKSTYKSANCFHNNMNKSYLCSVHSCLLHFKPHLFFLFIQWLLPAPLSVPRSLPPSLPQNCPLLEKMENAPSASTGRWTQSSTPADTCVCATTVGWSWRDRLMHAAQYAGGRSRTWSKHIGRDSRDSSTGVVTSLLGATCFPFSGFVGHRSWPQLKIATPGHNCAYIFHCVWVNNFWRQTRLFMCWTVTKLTLMHTVHMSSYILAKKDNMDRVLLFCIYHVISLWSHVVIEQTKPAVNILSLPSSS